MKKLIALIMVCAMLCTLLAGCGSSASQTPAADTNTAVSTADAGDAPVTIKLATNISTEDYKYAGLEEFKKQTEELSNGSITVELYPSSQLGGQSEIIEGMGMGTIEMTFLSPGGAQSFFPKIGIPAAMFIAQNEEHALKIWSSDYTQSILDEMAETINVKCINFCIEGARNIYTKVPVNTVDDLKGIKLRVPEVPSFVNSFTALGCNPTVMSFSEIYTGLQTGIVEGLECDIAGFIGNNLNDQCKYCYKSAHAVSVCAFMIANNFYDGLSEAQRSAVDTAAANVSEMLNEAYYTNLAESEAKLEADGVVFTTPSAEDMEKMSEIVGPVILESLDGLATQEDLDALKALAD